MNSYRNKVDQRAQVSDIAEYIRYRVNEKIINTMAHSVYSEFHSKFGALPIDGFHDDVWEALHDMTVTGIAD